MIKKNIFKIASVLVIAIVLLTSAVVWSFTPKKDLKPSQYGIGISYEQAIKEKKPCIVLFYADWCPHCIQFMPKFNALVKTYGDKYNYVMINAEKDSNKALDEEYVIGGIPTVYIIDPSIDNRVLIPNTIMGDSTRLKIEFDRYLRIRALIK